MSDKLKTVQGYLQLLETFSTSKADFERFLHPEVVQTEFPNMMTRKIQERGLTGCLEGAAMGKKILSAQKIEITSHLEDGEKMCVEAVWSGTLGMDGGPLKKGQIIKAYLGMVFEFKDGKVYRQRNYDCYEPFTN